MSANSDQIIDLFNEAARKSPEERRRYLDESCAAEPALREQVESLLRAHDAAAGFLDNPPLGSSPQILNEKPGDRIGRYKLLEKIGEGGCGVVYMAEQEEPVRRRVALKIIKLGVDTDRKGTRLNPS